MFDFNTVFIAAVFLLAGFVKGVIGLGLPTIAMGLLSLAMPPAQAAALLVIPSFVSNVWQLVGQPGLRALARRLATMLLGVCAGTWAGAGWLTRGPSAAAALVLGLALIAYALLGLLHVHWRVAPRAERWLSPVVGLATGLVTAATGVFVIPAVPYLQALGMEKERLVQALGLSFLVSTIALALNLGSGGALAGPAALASLGALLPTLAGMGLGQWLRVRTNPAVFRKVFFAGLLALGVYLALRHAAALV
jgi:uncharacterized membrane protein YfcA